MNAFKDFQFVKKSGGIQTVQKGFFLAVAIPFLTAFAIGTASPKAEAGDDTYAIGLWGDLAYSDIQATVGVPNLIADMNAQRLAFTVHDGDLKAGNSIAGSVTPTGCQDALYDQWLGFFNSLNAPTMFTPGDNDWTDCDRPFNGSFSSLERLDYERKVFFSTPYRLACVPCGKKCKRERYALARAVWSRVPKTVAGRLVGLRSRC